MTEKIKQYIADHFKIPANIIDFVYGCEKEIEWVFEELKQTEQLNQLKVLNAFIKNEVSSRHFNPSTGYGYGDEGREKLGAVYADAFNTESAIVSPLLMSGTHAIVTALFGLLRPGEKMFSLTGNPYDTLLSAIRGGEGSLYDYRIGYLNTPLKKDGTIDIGTALKMLRLEATVKVVYIQRSTGYELRKAFMPEELETIIWRIKSDFPNIVILVDNCYGEFVCANEPTDIGADVIVGSLIKNAGGGLAPTGGYIAGKKKYIDMIAQRFTAPGIGTEIGSYANGYREFFQGLFMAPHTVMQAMQGVILAAKVFSKLGYSTTPAFDDKRGDITQTITFGNEDELTAFVRGVQRASAIDSNVVPYAWDMPGYKEDVIMAAGTFVQGASLELTADAPMRKPYAAYLQGGLTYEHAKTGVIFALNELKKNI